MLALKQNRFFCCLRISKLNSLRRSWEAPTLVQELRRGLSHCSGESRKMTVKGSAGSNTEKSSKCTIELDLLIDTLRATDYEKIIVAIENPLDIILQSSFTSPQLD